MRIFLIFIFLISFQCCKEKKKIIKKQLSEEYVYSKDQIRIDTFNSFNFLIMLTPTCDKLLKNEAIKTECFDDFNYFEHKKFEKYLAENLDSSWVAFTDSELVISSIRERHGFGEVAVFFNTPTSIFINTIPVEQVSLETYGKNGDFSTLDCSCIGIEERKVILKLHKYDHLKSFYFNNKRIFNSQVPLNIQNKL